MASPRSVVVVDGNGPDRTNTVTLLEAAGYRVRSARSFDEAKTLLAAEPPDILITDLRLGQYNGLHLVLRSRSDHPEMAALVTSRVADPVLEAEAHRQRAQFILVPLTGTQLLQAVASSLGAAGKPLTKTPISQELC
ncbi:MAG: response regulator [Vicinamibacterales bacterium]